MTESDLKEFKINETGVTAPLGFLSSSFSAGIKYKDRDDMALIVSKGPCISAGMYTKNVVKAAPVLWDKKITDDNIPIFGIVINAGIANACTGEEGLSYCKKTAAALSEKLDVSPENILVASTGVIGMPLPIDKIINGVNNMTNTLSSTEEAGHQSSRAIMTTDTINKEASTSFLIDGKKVTIGAMTKGSGMIHPDMCTMLCFNTTDISITKELLKEALSLTVNDTYNMISVDGDTSTNDTCVILSNGLSKNKLIDKKDHDFNKFCNALTAVNRKLAMMMAGDGEGATALFEVKVINAKNDLDARTLAKSVISSSLVKAMIYGHDANLGRILCALGYSGVEFDPNRVDLTVTDGKEEILLAKDGMGLSFDEELAKKIFESEKVTAICDMKNGGYSATAWGCDLSHEYVSINADYRS